MMTPTADDLYRDILNPALDALEPLTRIKRDPRADVLLLAIAGQESNWTHRVQRGGGPARGLWQFERLGGVIGVLSHPATRYLAKRWCEARDTVPNSGIVHARLAHDDQLAAGFARLLLFTDPRPLPDLNDQDGAWDYYLRNWKPGKPHPDRWPSNYRAALSVVARARSES